MGRGRGGGGRQPGQLHPFSAPEAEKPGQPPFPADDTQRGLLSGRSGLTVAASIILPQPGGLYVSETSFADDNLLCTDYQPDFNRFFLYLPFYFRTGRRAEQLHRFSEQYQFHAQPPGKPDHDFPPMASSDESLQ